MKTELGKLIESLGYELYEQGSFTSTEQYPESFFTCENFETNVDKHYDNDDFRTVWGFWLSFYSTDIANVQNVIDDTRRLLKQNGWKVPTRGNDVDSGSSQHAGRELTIYFEEEKQ